MRLSTAVTLALTVLLATSVLGAVAATPSATSSTASDRSPSDPPLQSPAAHHSLSEAQVSPDTHSLTAATDQRSPLSPTDPAQVIRIAITDTGDAEWTIESRFLLTDEDDVETFMAYADAVTAGDRNTEFDRERFVQEARNVEASTGRSMSIENMAWDDPHTEAIDDPDDEFDEDTQVGVLSYSFTWTNFAATDDDRIYLGDAFETSQGTWLTTLGEEQRLVIRSPPGYSFDEFATPPTTQTNGAFVWDGPRQFSEGDFDIVFVRVAGGVSSWWPPTGVTLGATALLVTVTVAGIGYLVVRRRSDGDGSILDRLPWWPGSEETTAADTAASDGGAGTSATSSAASSASADGDGDAELTFEEDEDVDLELLSDEERVTRLLRQNGGRMKQGSIVSETGWSNAKVSQLLSKMDDDDEIEKLRIGRENLITLPDVDPTEID